MNSIHLGVRFYLKAMKRTPKSTDEAKGRRCMIVYSALRVQKITSGDLTEFGMVVEDEGENPVLCD